MVTIILKIPASKAKIDKINDFGVFVANKNILEFEVVMDKSKIMERS